MANDNNVNIGVELNTRSAVKSLNDFKQLLKKSFGKSDAPVEMEKVKRELAEATKEVTKLSNEYKKFAVDAKRSPGVKNLARELDTARTKLSKLTSEYNATVDGNPTNKKIKGLQKDLATAESTTAKLQEHYNQIVQGQFTSKGVTDAQKNLANLKKEAEKLEEKLEKAKIKFAELVNKSGGMTEEQYMDRSVTVNGKEFHVDSAGNELKAVKFGDKYFNEADAATAKIKTLYNEIQTLTNKLSDANQAVNAASSNIFVKMGEEADQATAELNSAISNTNSINNQLLSAQQAQEQELKTATNYVAELNSEFNIKKDAEITAAANAVKDAETKVTQLTNRLKELQKQGKKSHHLADAFENARIRGERLIGMMKRMTIRLLFYQTFGKAIRSTVDYIKQAVNADNELSRSVNILRGNILTAFQQIYTFLRPIIMAIIGLLNLLTGIFNKFMSLLTGKSVKSSQAAAKSMYNLGKATGSAGKEAKKTLASFDELIQIGDKSQPASGGGDAGAAPPEFVDPEQFKLSEDIQEALKAIAGLLGYILAGIILIKGALGFLGGLVTLLQYIGKILANFGTNGPLATIAGILLIIAGALVLVENYSDAWMNGLDWENFAGVLAGLGMIIGGLVLVFGQIVLPIALVGAGIAAIVLSVHDMIKQGPTLKNQLMLFIGLIATVTGLIMGGHAALGLIIAIIGAAILIAGNFGDQWSNIMQHVGQIVEGFVKLVKDLINGDYKAAWEDAKDILKGFANLGIDIFEGLVKAAIKAVNKIISAINSIKFGPVPDWVPIVGGKEFSFNLKEISTSWSLPRFAQGAVIPPNKEFMAVLGDQKHGTNIETPLDTMIQAFNTALDSRGNSQNINIRFDGNLAQLARILKPYLDDDDVRQGTRRSNGLIVGGSY